MARIRSLKPEAFQSETLSLVSVTAERTFFGLSTQVDDRGRITDKPAQINGLLWAMRGNHTTADTEAELKELESVGLMCRYQGCDGKPYLHLVTFDDHQKVDHPSRSRLPRCPKHGVADYCGKHQGDCPDSLPPETLANPREASRLDLGPRTLDHGSRTVPPTAARKTRPRESLAKEEQPAAQALIGEWIEHCRKRPPDRVIGQTSKHIKSMLEEGIDPEDIRRGLAMWHSRGLDPSVLPSVVNEVMNSTGVRTRRQQATDEQFDRAMARAEARERANDPARNGAADPIRPSLLPATGDR